MERHNTAGYITGTPKDKQDMVMKHLATTISKNIKSMAMIRKLFVDRVEVFKVIVSNGLLAGRVIKFFDSINNTLEINQQTLNINASKTVVRFHQTKNKLGLFFKDNQSEFNYLRQKDFYGRKVIIFNIRDHYAKQINGIT